MPITPPHPGIPQIPHGSIYKGGRFARTKPQVRAAIIPLAGGSSAILRAIMLSGLAGLAVTYYQSVVGDVETDLDDLTEEIERWLKSERSFRGFSRGSPDPERGNRTLALPIPLKPNSRPTTRSVDEAEPLKDRENRRKGDEDRRTRETPDGALDFWQWLERRYGQPPRYQYQRSMQNGISQF